MAVKFTQAEVNDIVGEQEAEVFNTEANSNLEKAAVILKYFKAGLDAAPLKPVVKK